MNEYKVKAEVFVKNLDFFSRPSIEKRQILLIIRAESAMDAYITIKEQKYYDILSMFAKDCVERVEFTDIAKI